MCVIFFEEEGAQEVSGGYEEEADADDKPKLGSLDGEVFENKIGAAGFKNPTENASKEELKSVFEGKDIPESNYIEGIEGETCPKP